MHGMLIELCPFCGSRCDITSVDTGSGYDETWVACQEDDGRCGFQSAYGTTLSDAIKKHNRVCRDIEAGREATKFLDAATVAPGTMVDRLSELVRYYEDLMEESTQ